MSSIRTVSVAKRIFNFGNKLRVFNASVPSTVHFSPNPNAVKPNTRWMSTISRYPVPERNSLPEDLQEVMNEVEEKVNIHSKYFFSGMELAAC